MLDAVDESSERAIDDCGAIGNALVIRTGQEKDPHFNDRGEQTLIHWGVGVGGLPGKEGDGGAFDAEGGEHPVAPGSHKGGGE